MIWSLSQAIRDSEYPQSYSVQAPIPQAWEYLKYSQSGVYLCDYS